MYVDGINFQRIARLLGVYHQTGINAVTGISAVDASSAQLPSPPKQRQQQPVDTLELDEIHSCVGEQETAYILACAERATRCILSFAVVCQRDWNQLQDLVAQVLPARVSDLIPSLI